MTQAHEDNSAAGSDNNKGRRMQSMHTAAEIRTLITLLPYRVFLTEKLLTGVLDMMCTKCYVQTSKQKKCK